MGSEVQQMTLVALLGMHRSNRKLTTSQGPRLIEDHRSNPGQHIHIIGALDKDAFTRGTANAAKESQRYADNQGARTRDHKKHQGAIQPRCKSTREIAREQRRQQGQSQSSEDHDWCIDTGKSGDESLAPRLAFSGILHEVDNL